MQVWFPTQQGTKSKNMFIGLSRVYVQHVHFFILERFDSASLFPHEHDQSNSFDLSGLGGCRGLLWGGISDEGVPTLGSHFWL